LTLANGFLATFSSSGLATGAFVAIEALFGASFLASSSFLA